MTMISQDEIVSNAKTVTKGLEALRQEHQAILGGIRTSLGAVDLGPEGENSLITEKCALMERSLEMIELGLGEAHVMAALATHLQATEAEKQKLRSQVDPKTQKSITPWITGEATLSGEYLVERRISFDSTEASGNLVVLESSFSISFSDKKYIEEEEVLKTQRKYNLLNCY